MADPLSQAALDKSPQVIDSKAVPDSALQQGNKDASQSVSDNKVILKLYSGGFETRGTILEVPGLPSNYMLCKAASTEDFRLTSLGYEATSVSIGGMGGGNLFMSLKDKNLAKVVFVGHGTAEKGGALGLSGGFDVNGDVLFSDSINVASVAEAAKDEALVKAIRKSFTNCESFDICACYVGQDTVFIQALADLFQCKVRALTFEVAWLWQKVGEKLYSTSRLGYVIDGKTEVGPESRFGVRGMTVSSLFSNCSPIPVIGTPKVNGK